MVDEKLSKSLKTVLARAIDEASSRRSATVEAEHLLLALAGDQKLAAARVLADAGLTHDAIEAALNRERAESLAAAGIGPVDEGRLAATPRQSRPGWGASVKEAIARGKDASREDRQRRSAETELLIGILRASLGTVPRALVIAGVDRSNLVERARQA